MPLFTDQIGRTVELKAPPKRIVSLVPSITESICDLGFQDAVVGATDYCVHPEGLNCERLGGTKNFKISLIESLQPDLIVANKEENPKIPIENLAEKYPVWVSEVKDTESALEMMRLLGTMLAVEKRAEALINSMKEGLHSIAAFGKTTEDQRRPSALYLIWRKPYMAAGSDTFISHMLATVGLTNVLDTWAGKGLRYPRITDEDFRELQPDFILLSTEPYPFKQADAEAMKIHSKHSAMLVDGEAFSWYGSRIVHCMSALQEFAGYIASFR